MPFPLSVTPLREPAVVESVTVAPPVVSGVPDASRSSTVIVEVLVPFAGIEVGDAVICDVAPDGGPGPVNVTVAVSVIGEPPTVPLTVALPAVDGAVRAVVYVPSPLSVTGDPSVPAVVDS